MGWTVGFFLGGLVTHGGVQGWWIEPVLGSLGELPLALVATVLTAFNDNAAITYLSTLVPGFTDGLKYAAVAGAESSDETWNPVRARTTRSRRHRAAARSSA